MDDREKLTSEIDRIRKQTRERAIDLLHSLGNELQQIKMYPQYAELERILTRYAL